MLRNGAREKALSRKVMLSLLMAGTMSVCISGGDYVAFVDSDDWLELDMYERLYETSKKWDLTS